MARKSGTKNITSNAFQTVNATERTVVSADLETIISAGKDAVGEVQINSNSGQVVINQIGDGKAVINPNGGLTTINERAGGDVTINDGGVGTVTINKFGGDVSINEGGGELLVGSANNIFSSAQNVGSVDNPGGALQPDIDQGLFSTTAQRQLASAYFAGGVGIEQDLAVGGFIYGRIAESLTSTQVSVQSTNTNIEHYPIFVRNFVTATGTILYGDNDPEDLRYNPALGRLTVRRVNVVSSETSTSTDTGAVQVAGGMSVAQDITVGGVVYGFNDFTTQYLENIYDKYLGLQASKSKIALAAGATDIFGEIQVRGKNPIGTGPVVTNVLYVTVDGNDTNDGRAQDPSRACRTIGGVLKSPYYQPGTQIRVSAGRYLENNPLELKPYTSVMGSDIRTTFIEPINKTQDLFHLTSGCYLAFMTFLNGRSGKLKGDYAPGTNRGAYATAFPPQTGDNRIDLFHSPYVQNCTNQSGPWLNDGTMFVPSQTVQIPQVVGTGTWAANTTTIVVRASTGTIKIGQYVNAGQQNPGFFNARTLLLANKPFLQEQTVAFVDYTFNSGAFVYNQTKCRRDTVLILNAIGIDMLYDDNSDSTFSGLQYWNQGTYTGDIPNEITATIAAFTFLEGLAKTYVEGAVVPTVESLFSTLTNILTVGPAGVTDQIIYGGLPSTDPTIVLSFDGLQNNKTTMQHAVIDWLSTSYPTLVYNTASCFRDVGYIIDSVSFDILHSGNVQTIKSGVYYYDYNGNSTAIPNEIPQTTAAYNYIKSILPNIVTGTPLPTTYQTGTTQIIVGDRGNAYDAEVLESKLDIITDIIRNGPGVAPELKPISLIYHPSTSALNAYNLLLANADFIKEEVIAYIDATMNNFQYNRQKCYRDTAILVENMAYDMAFGGNEKSVESGLAYYNGVVSVIAGQETQTISAIDYLSELCKLVVQNQPAPWLPVPAEIAIGSTATQVINTVLVGGEVALESIENLFNITTAIIEDGPTVAPQIYTSTGPDAAYVSAEILMEANRTFIQENTLNYINRVLCNPPKALPYNQIKCRRDAGVILDSISSDMYFGGYSQSTFAGRQYYAIDGYTGSIKTEIQPTIRAVKYLRDMSLKVVQSITTATDAQAGIIRYSTGTQFTSTNIASPDVLSEIELEYNIILNILKGNITGWTDNIVPNGATPTQLPGWGNAITLLQENRLYLQQEILAYIIATNDGFVFDQATCARDVGYIVDAVTFDIKYGGNRMAVQSGLGYYDNVGTENVVEGEVTATIEAFTFMTDVASALITGTNYVPLQTVVKPITNLSTGTITEVLKLQESLSTITNIILNGPSVAGPQYPTPLVPLDQPVTFDQIKCRRDIGFVLNSIGFDMLYDSISDSQFSGLQYWNQGTLNGVLPAEITATIASITYLGSLALTYVSSTNDARVESLFTTVTNILTVGLDGISDFIEYGGLPSTDPIIIEDYNALQTNKNSMQHAVITYVESNFPSLTFNTSTCFRDVGYIIDSVSFDLLHGGNVQSIKSGAYYYSFNGSSTTIPGEIAQTTAAYNYLKTLLNYVVTRTPLPFTYQTIIPQTLIGEPGSTVEVNALQNKVSYIIDIINDGPSAAGTRIPLTGTIGGGTAIAAFNMLLSNEAFIKEEVLAYVTTVFNKSKNAFEIIKANRSFLAAETVAWLDQTFNPDSFNYDQDLCYRDTGLIIDAVSQDILLGGNQKSLEAGKSYWNKGYNYVSGQITTTTAAINYARDISLKIIANQPVTPVTGTVATQVINTFFDYGGNYMPQEAVIRNFGIITNIIENGPEAAPPQYAGGGLFSLTGLNGSDVLPPPQVTRIDQISSQTFAIGLSTSTIGFGLNATLYFGEITIFPLQDDQVEELSLLYTGNASTWNQRKVDDEGSMGGSLVDGAVISNRSPIQSFVYDAYTQVNQGGLGVHVTNNGYAQLVSVFTIFCSIGVLCDNGGIASITNSNCNFGSISLMSKGYGPRKFSGTVFNPAFRSYPFSPQGVDNNGNPLPFLDQFYPTGYWPNLGRAQIFVPDEEDRPHIGLVMEIIPPDGHINEQGFPGFLNSQPSTSTLATGTIVLTNISTDDIAIGNDVFIRDQFGKQFDDFPYLHDPDGNPIDLSGNRVSDPSLAPPNPNYKKWYAATGTVVTDVNYNAITLNQALTNGGGDPANPSYFTLYFCGNSYYTVQTSSKAIDPYQSGTNKLAANTSTYFQGPSVSQVAAHIAAINHLMTCTAAIISNVPITPTPTTATNYSQVINTTVIGGADAKPFIDLRFGYIKDIVNAANLSAANAIVPPLSRVREGPLAPGSGAAVTLIDLNIEFLAQEVAAWSIANSPGILDGSQEGQRAKCARDVKIILQAMIYDLETGGNYNSVYAGLSYWMIPGTYHIVTLGESVRRPDLFPDGATANFYQRSYISASGYLFEYVGAGTNYGALPQRGVADPDQLREVVQLNNGKVFYTSTDQNGDFRIGPGLVIAQATGVLTGRTFVQSLYANMTPFILAID